MAAVARGRDATAAAEAKRVYLDSATADRRGGRHSTGVRYWVTYCVHVLGVNPIQPRDATDAVRRLYEEWLEDMCVWVAEHRPGRSTGASAKSIGKYASQARGWYRRFYGGTLGMGAAASRIPDLLAGMRRTSTTPPPSRLRRRSGMATCCSVSSTTCARARSGLARARRRQLRRSAVRRR